MLKTKAPYICNSCVSGSHENCNSNGADCECDVCLDGVVFCSEEGCENEAYKFGLCSTHHEQLICRHVFAKRTGYGMSCDSCGLVEEYF